MEEIRAIALAYYNNGSGNTKQIANKFLLSMDEDGDGKISVGEYLAFMRKQDVVDLRMCNPGFFNCLKKDQKPLLCFKCYRDKKFVHGHSGLFLLIVMNERNLDKNKTNELRTTETGASSSMAIVPASSSHGRGPAYMIAKVALKTVELAAGIGSANFKL
ncbi:hypothetical protein F0562_000571 [Nyssa sinensis]|uniref:EF-hand domain-containing protein n=1 Tax=Nyssa sinensis TaxID=561372 RepID=A0A5J5C4P6_9ASTE|nr:hypothetical protein F0562_000571 [Nyssa sinensis]